MLEKKSFIKQKIVDEALKKTRSDFFRNAMDIKGLTIVSLAQISGVSRQTIYGTMNGTTKPDTKTIIKLAKALNVDTSALLSLIQSQNTMQRDIKPNEKIKYKEFVEKALEIAVTMSVTAKDILELLIYLRKSWLCRYRKHKTTDYSSFICDVNYPDDSIVYVNQLFTKRWAIQNSGISQWIGRKLVCIDKKQETLYDRKDGYALAENNRLVPLQREVPIPNTLPGEPVIITAQFKAPPLPCTTFSYWKMYDKDGNQCLSDQIGLYCRVIVVDI